MHQNVNKFILSCDAVLKKLWQLQRLCFRCSNFRSISFIISFSSNADNQFTAACCFSLLFFRCECSLVYMLWYQVAKDRKLWHSWTRSDIGCCQQGWYSCHYDEPLRTYCRSSGRLSPLLLERHTLCQRLPSDHQELQHPKEEAKAIVESHEILKSRNFMIHPSRENSWSTNGKAESWMTKPLHGRMAFQKKWSLAHQGVMKGSFDWEVRMTPFSTEVELTPFGWASFSFSLCIVSPNSCSAILKASRFGATTFKKTARVPSAQHQNWNWWRSYTSEETHVHEANRTNNTWMDKSQDQKLHKAKSFQQNVYLYKWRDSLHQ